MLCLRPALSPAALGAIVAVVTIILVACLISLGFLIYRRRRRTSREPRDLEVFSDTGRLNSPVHTTDPAMRSTINLTPRKITENWSEYYREFQATDLPTAVQNVNDDDEEIPDFFGIPAQRAIQVAVAQPQPENPSTSSRDWDPLFSPSVPPAAPTHTARPRSISPSAAPDPAPNHQPSTDTANHAPVPFVGLPIMIAHQTALSNAPTGPRFYKAVHSALRKLRDGYAVCWGRGLEWSTHLPDRCPNAITNSRDEFWSSWFPGGARAVKGYWWGCCLPQIKGAHDYLDDDKLDLCPDRNLIKAAIYAWATKPADDIKLSSGFGVPAAMLVVNFTIFWGRSLDMEPGGEMKTTNLLRLFYLLALRRGLI
ncbi:hypothetical protein DFH09DRAFT_1315707 [Mycena vulgaris]|nr:hypothetical protein DFH09DRAFT_1315707 [Mycena vulgaris]